MKAVFWNYRFDDMQKSWSKQTLWLINSLQKEGIEVKIHEGFKCKGTEKLSRYNCREDNPCDICIYNHATMGDLVGNVVKADHNWFFKPTIPDDVHTTLDDLGYGPYSSITYEKPDFENVDNLEVNGFFNKQVKNWLEKRTTKFDNYFYHFKNKVQEVPYNDYFLIIGQCGGDTVVTTHDFGSYFCKMEQIVRELIRISDKLIVIKLHPYVDGKDAKTTEFADIDRKSVV